MIIMPRQDKTGPAGVGPFTGRGMGICGTGRGNYMGRGRGFGRFCGCSPYQRVVTKEEESNILNEESEILKEELKAVKERIDELKN